MTEAVLDATKQDLQLLGDERRSQLGLLGLQVRPLSVGSEQSEKWKITSLITANDKVEYFEATSEYGTLYFGKWSDGHIGWRWQEEGGGGPITIPYSFDGNGQLLIGLRKEMRDNLGGERLCAIGGFKDPGETNEAAQAREAMEECDMDTAKAIPSHAPPFISNRNYFIGDANEDEGIHPFFLEIPSAWLVSKGSETYALQAGKIDPETIKNQQSVVFLPWQRAINETVDGIARAGIATLVADVFPPIPDANKYPHIVM
ncbi:MAG TPA: NUDIX hydrolase [Patescibacteria group bacterium]|jgi:hypothetical protein|nr:NUDIX hydrolase [Patescibacteria group bacterium]